MASERTKALTDPTPVTGPQAHYEVGRIVRMLSVVIVLQALDLALEILEAATR